MSSQEDGLQILNIHTPTASFSLVHSFTQDSLQTLYDKLSRKAHTPYPGARVGPGWLKYEHAGTVWNLDDDSDYTIFSWRQHQPPNQDGLKDPSEPSGLLSPTPSSYGQVPTLHLHKPNETLPAPPAYQNPSYYLFNPSHSRAHSPNPTVRRAKSMKSTVSKRGTITSKKTNGTLTDALPTHKEKFDKFHSENGVRTVMGSIGPVTNVRMLLKSGYRHVYISRKFAVGNGFIPGDAAPGHYGYGGLVNIGSWPVTLYSSSTIPSGSEDEGRSASGESHLYLSSTPTPSVKKAARSSSSGSLLTLRYDGGDSASTSKAKSVHKKKKRAKSVDAFGTGKTVNVPVYLSEEPHFDVVLGRSFFEKRQIKTDAIDPTDVVCMDTGEKIECELVILKDGRGEIVTVT